MRPVILVVCPAYSTRGPSPQYDTGRREVVVFFATSHR
jgi:hypothetical protein